MYKNVGFALISDTFFIFQRTGFNNDYERFPMVEGYSDSSANPCAVCHPMRRLYAKT